MPKAFEFASSRKKPPGRKWNQISKPKNKTRKSSNRFEGEAEEEGEGEGEELARKKMESDLIAQESRKTLVGFNDNDDKNDKDKNNNNNDNHNHSARTKTAPE